MKISLLLVLVVACAPGGPDAPTGLTVREGPTTVARSAAFTTAPGDTLAYALSWSAGARATGYQVTVRSSSAGWTGLPVATPVALLSYAFKAINLTAWDTNTFTAVVRSTNARGLSRDSAFVIWAVSRGPGKPGPVIVDSSGALVSLLIRPEAVALEAMSAACAAIPDTLRWLDTTLTPVAACLKSTQQFCGFLKMLDGKYRMDAGQGAKRYCKALYDLLPADERLPGYPISTRPRLTTQQWVAALGR